MSKNNHISWIPPWINEKNIECIEIDTANAGNIRFECHRPKLESWEEIGAGFKKIKQKLMTLSVEQIIASIDKVAHRWLDPNFPPRQQTIESVAKATLFSKEAVAESFNVELRNYFSTSLLSVLKRELGDIQQLDHFQHDSDLEGYSKAYGPNTILGIFTGNVPGLPALTMVRCLLAKSPLIAKVAGGEPSFAASFARTLWEENPILGDAILCTYWRRDEHAVLENSLKQVDTLVVYGGTEACQALKKKLHSHQRYIEHGHKVSFGIITKNYLTEQGEIAVAKAIARDTSVFNQHACIAPQIYFLVLTDKQAKQLGTHIAIEMDNYAKAVPLGKLTEVEACVLQLKRALLHWQTSDDENIHMWHSKTNLDWTVTLHNKLVLSIGSGNRFLKLVCVPNIETIFEMVTPFSHLLQNIALGGVKEHELKDIAERFGQMGASRICQPGHMIDPSMMWRHDGRMCVAELLRWCDVEMHYTWKSK